MANDWYIKIGNAEYGPLSSDKLKQLALQGKVAPKTPIKHGASGNWVFASAVNGLQFGSETSQVSPIPSRPIPTAAPKRPPLKPPSAPATRSLDIDAMIQGEESHKSAHVMYGRTRAAGSPRGEVGRAIGIFGGAFAATMILAVIVVILWAGWQEAAQRQSSADRESERVIADVSAEDLTTEYERNEVAADERYSGKVVKVSGRIIDIGKDIAGTMYVLLRPGQQTHSLGVQCLFADSEKGTLISLSGGQSVTIKGRCDGLMGTVQLEGCVIIAGR